MSNIKLELPSAPDTSAIDIKDEGSLIVSNPTAMNFTGPGVTVTENPTGTAEVDIPGLQYWTESEDAATQQSTIFTPNNSATDVNAVLLPKGNGANLAQTPDGTTTGGNARGQYSTDWQKVRSNANEVASGQSSVLVGGRFNKATGTYSGVLSGSGNSATGVSSFVGGGSSNSATGVLSGVLNGNSNVASGARSVALNGANIASGSYSIATGEISQSTGDFSMALGYNSIAYLRAMSARGGGRFLNSAGQTVNASAQHTKTNLSRRISALSGDTFDISIDATGTTNLYILLGNNRASNVMAQFVLSVIDITGTATGVTIGDYMTQTLTFGAKRVAGTCTVTSATILSTAGDVSITASATIAFAAGASNEIKTTVTAPTFVGGGTLILGASCTFITTEVSTIV